MNISRDTESATEQSYLPPNQTSPFWALRLALVVAITPLAIDTYLPAMPIMADHYGSSVQQVGFSVGLYLISYALGQMLGGPLSDRHGRRPILLSGLVVFCAASLCIALSDSIEALWFWRVIQAFGGGFAIVTVGAIVRDRFDGIEAAKQFSLIAIIMMIAPLVAPAIGAILLWLANWQAIFWFLMIYAMLVCLLSYRSLEESNPPQASKADIPLWLEMWRNYKSVLSHRFAMSYVLAMAFGYATLFIFLSEASFIYMIQFGLSANLMPVFFAANVVMIVFANRLNLRLLAFIKPSKLILIGLSVQVAATLSLVLLSQFGEPTLYVVAGLLVFAIGSLGLVSANATASTLSYFPDQSGTANAVIGTTEFIIGGAIGALVTSIVHDDLRLTFACMLISGVLALVSQCLRLKK